MQNRKWITLPFSENGQREQNGPFQKGKTGLQRENKIDFLQKAVQEVGGHYR